MVKKIHQPILIFLFFYLALFPFGQLPRLIFDFLGVPLPLHLTDIVILVYTFVFAKKKKSFPFLIIAAFAWAVNAVMLGKESIIGLIYLIRLGSYTIFFQNLFETALSKTQKNFLLRALLAIGVTIAVLGIFQYIFLPDLRALYSIGWDDHYYRLTSSFLDPAFAGIVLVFALLLSIERKSWFSSMPIAIALALTYSRASYLALFVGLGVFLIRKIPSKKFFPILIAIFAVVIFVLPKPGGEGVNLLRTSSIFAKAQNYQESLQLIQKSPLLGVGFNNLCAVRGAAPSHACSGLDNSILFVLATTGILGMIAFMALIAQIKTKDKLLFATLAALFVHMQFTNTLFYPWVWGWLGVLWSVRYRNR